MGRAMAESLLEKGHRVVALDAFGTGLKDLERHAVGAGMAERLQTACGDIGQRAHCEEAIKLAVERFGALHVVINNAGQGMKAIREDYLSNPVRFWEVDPDRWQAVMNTNVRGPFLLSRAAAPHLLKAGWGRIINITTSFDTMLRASYTPYGPSKASLEAATSCWSRDLEGSGVSANVLVPGGAVDTKYFSDSAPLDRGTLIRPDVMIPPLQWLTSTASDGVNGMRFIARLWDPQSSVEAAVQAAGAPVAWPNAGPKSHGPAEFWTR
jgi:NAD(P)-dependent dehydrogenase (short-subunit alcohol dehydrogenase family)